MSERCFADLDVAGAATYLGVSESWVRKRVATRAIPFYKVGALIRFSASDLDEYVRSRREGPAADVASLWHLEAASGGRGRLPRRRKGL